MREVYRPKSDFLMMVLHDEVPLTGGGLADANLARLIELTSDSDDSNRDWAVTLLRDSGVDTTETRAALRRAGDDPHLVTRCEALLGLAVIEPIFALPRVREVIDGEEVTSQILEAAALLADHSLVSSLEEWLDDLAAADDGWLRDALNTALEASRTGRVPETLEWRLPD